jgi:hypothetical protein
LDSAAAVGAGDSFVLCGFLGDGPQGFNMEVTMSFNNSGPNWEVTRETSEGTPLAVSNGNQEFDVVTGGDHVFFVQNEEGETIDTLDDRD